METQVRRPQAGRPGRWAFVSGKRKQSTITTTTISDEQGRTWGTRAEPTFTAGTPKHLIAATAAALADPTPVAPLQPPAPTPAG
jgi:hypothetical protein